MRQGFLDISAGTRNLRQVAFVVVRVDVRRRVGEKQFEGVPGRGREVDVPVAETLFELIEENECGNGRCSLFDKIGP
jgi:hypothetical protein